MGLPAPDWLGDPDTALFALVFVSIWKGRRYDMVILAASDAAGLGPRGSTGVGPGRGSDHRVAAPRPDPLPPVTGLLA
jgi:hypothetical protein